MKWNQISSVVYSRSGMDLSEDLEPLLKRRNEVKVRIDLTESKLDFQYSWSSCDVYNR
jgi:hypothetical protein